MDFRPSSRGLHTLRSVRSEEPVQGIPFPLRKNQRAPDRFPLPFCGSKPQYRPGYTFRSPLFLSESPTSLREFRLPQRYRASRLFRRYRFQYTLNSCVLPFSLIFRYPSNNGFQPSVRTVHDLAELPPHSPGASPYFSQPPISHRAAAFSIYLIRTASLQYLQRSQQ